jgi:hypothetical protein
MNVYYLRADSNKNRGLIVTQGNPHEFYHLFNGFPLNPSWKDVTIGWDPDMRRLPKGDFPDLFTHIPVFTPRAVDALSGQLEGNGELLPILIAGEEYFLYNVTRVIDALDESRSEIIRFDDSSKFLDVEVHCFFPEKIGNTTIFKIPQMVTMDVFVTEVFVQRVKSARLKGFDFPILWSSEFQVEHDPATAFFR